MIRVFPFVDQLLLTHFSDTLFPIHFVQRHFFYETFSVIAFLASEYSLAI